MTNLFWFRKENGVSNINEPMEPKVEDNKDEKDRVYNWVLCRWYFCPNCKAFQLPKKEDFDGLIAECKICKQKIDYKNYIK